MRHCKVVNKALQSALAKLFMSSSCYPFVRGRKAETRWQATPPDLFAGYERDQPKQDESPVMATYESLRFWFIGNVRGDSSQACDPGSSRMKSKYGTEGETPPGIHIAVEILCHGRARVVSLRDKRPGSTVFITNIDVRNAFVLSRPWRRGGRARSGSGGAVSYPARSACSGHPEPWGGKRPQKGVSGGTILRYIAGNRESNMDLPYGARTTRISSWLDSMRNGFEENPPT